VSGTGTAGIAPAGLGGRVLDGGQELLDVQGDAVAAVVDGLDDPGRGAWPSSARVRAAVWSLVSRGRRTSSAWRAVSSRSRAAPDWRRSLARSSSSPPEASTSPGKVAARTTPNDRLLPGGGLDQAPVGQGQEVVAAHQDRRLQRAMTGQPCLRK
jgi:hypothetical protein